eukprot:GHVP01012149.1.p1 GENE.GHVP01012149.1~~GHVP01012149.1.p1  ORF type:complete len:118 (+),score=6.89 GHVP01012149.1:75-428(+)
MNESHHRILDHALRTSIDLIDGTTSFQEVPNDVLFAHNVTVNEATGDTPFFLIQRRDLPSKVPRSVLLSRLSVLGREIPPELAKLVPDLFCRKYSPNKVSPMFQEPTYSTHFTYSKS